MLSFSHLVIIVIFAVIFLGPEKIPQFFKSLSEGLLIFKKTFEEGRSGEIPSKQKKYKKNKQSYNYKKKNKTKNKKI